MQSSTMLNRLSAMMLLISTILLCLASIPIASASPSNAGSKMLQARTPNPQRRFQHYSAFIASCCSGGETGGVVDSVECCGVEATCCGASCCDNDAVCSISVDGVATCSATFENSGANLAKINTTETNKTHTNGTNNGTNNGPGGDSAGHSIYTAQWSTGVLGLAAVVGAMLL